MSELISVYRSEAESWQQINPSSIYARKPPNIFNFQCHDEQLRRFIVREVATENAEVGAQDIYMFRNAYVRPDATVYNSAGHLIELSAIDRAPEKNFECRGEDCHRVGGQSVLIFKAGFDNYGHLLIEMLPKIDLILEENFDNPTFLLPVMSPALHSVVLEVLKVYYREPYRIIVLDMNVIAEELYIPGPVSKHNTRKSKQVADFWAKLPNVEWVGGRSYPEKIYISRRGSSKRPIPDEGKVEQLLVEKGFSIIRPEEHAFFDQVAIFRRARQIVGPLGAGLSSSIFAGETSTITVLDPGLYDFFFYDLCSLRGQEFNWIFTQPLDYKTVASLHRPTQEIFVDVKRPLEWVLG
ncbi:glycosyltransferase family 61 protein [Ensifer sp. LC163]|uniref:glycosyltransferase family 61 protein n=1 Tax=Ensifer sp. LC163 TaxID=1120652 RepID=UPI000812DEB2|nr:glycosyltransferase 61 family protein [Ensifer sp. LC163]OCP35050.1 hypothetical protein BC360_28630 [Ensifer sp. LC163]